MIGSAGSGTGPSDEVAGLLPLALSRPGDALELARKVLAGSPSPYEASIAAHAIGIVLRDRGEVAAAIRQLRRARTFARAGGDVEREIDVCATLGVALIWIGRTSLGLELLDTAAKAAHGLLAGQVLLRRAHALYNLGRYGEASDDLNTALPLLRRAGDEVWQARALTHRALIGLLTGAIARARADFERAEALFHRTGQQYESAVARHNLGIVAFAEGDLPGALSVLAEAARQYDEVDAADAAKGDLQIDRSAMLLAAGLAREAVAEADAGVAAMSAGGGPAYKRAELLLSAANAALAVPDPPLAIERARTAQRLFRAQRRDIWQARSELVLAHARHAAKQDSLGLLTRTSSLAARLEDLDSEQAQRAHLLAGRIALALGRAADAAGHLETAARTRRGAPPLVRSLGRLARALAREAAGDDRATLAACRAGLAALDEHRLRLGSTELRAHATGHGAELSGIVLRVMLRRGDPRQLLTAGERWRAMTIAVPPRPAQKGMEDHARDLTALRSVVRQLEEDRLAGRPTTTLDRDRRRLEREIRDRSLQRRGDGTGPGDRFDLHALADVLGPTRLVELVEVDGRLQVLTVVAGRVRRHTGGSTPALLVEQARFHLRRAARAGPARQLPDLINTIGTRLQEALLGPALADLGTDEPVVVVPPGPLHALPWALLPGLRDRVLSLAPSASTLLQMHGLPAPTHQRTTLVAGPGLAATEVTRLSVEYPGATVLRDGSATAEKVLEALDGAALAHVAAHGTFRSDNPLFSSVSLDDGPLTVHDFERLQQAPYRLLLPSCDSGVAAPVGADELLGLVSSLVALGSAGVLAGIAEINDEATAPIMIDLHARLRAGDGLPEALLAARRANADDPLAVATGYSFIAFGI